MAGIDLRSSTSGSGASAAGLTWPGSFYTTSQTATAGSGYPMNATSGNLTVTLPGSPTVGQQVGAFKTDSSANTVTFVGTVDGQTNGVITTQNAGATLTYVGGTVGWKITDSYLVTGPAGPQGPAATVAVGTVTTGAAGSSAAITNAGTSTAAILNFTIPKGDTGATGAAGTNGAVSQVQAAGSAVTLRPTLDFEGAGVVVTDDAPNTRTKITIGGGALTAQARSNGVLAWTVDPATATSNFQPALSGLTATAYFYRCVVAATGTAGTIYWPVGALGTGLTYARWALFDVNGTQTAITGDAVSAMDSGSVGSAGNRSLALGSTVSVAAGDIIVLGLLCVGNGATSPTLRGSSGFGIKMGPAVTTSNPPRIGLLTGQSTMPSSVDWTTLTVNDNQAICTAGIA